MIALSAGALLRLIRPPNVFTAFADALAGLLMLLGLGYALPERAGMVLLASGCLYLAGIVLNDVFDRDVDARERPRRPIPSGEVSPGLAAALGITLLLGGVGIGWWIGLATGVMATALASCILLYDGGLKRTRLGPLVMGGCRGLDVAMALSTGLTLDARWPAIAIAGPVVLGLYVAGLTYIARDEVDGNATRRARTGLGALAVLAATVTLTLMLCPGWPRSSLAWPWLAIVLALGWRNWAPVWRRHDGPSTGRAIGGGIMLIPIIDAALAAVAGSPLWALAVAALVVPALVLKQFFSPHLTMRLGYNTNGFAHHRLPDALAVIADLGYQAVGITLDVHHLDPFAADHRAQLTETAAVCRQLGLLPVIETGARFLLDPRRKHRPTLLAAGAGERATRIDFLSRAIDVAAALGAPVVSLWSGAADDDPGAAALDDRLAAGLRVVCARARAAGVVVGFEPEPGMYIEDMPGFARLRALVDDPAFKLTLDVGHAHLTEDAGAEATVRGWATEIVNVHVEGMTRREHDHLVPWEGDLDVRAVMQTLVEVGYLGPACFELSRHSHDAVRIARRAFEFLTPGA